MTNNDNTDYMNPSEKRLLRATQERRSVFDNIFNKPYAQSQLVLLDPENHQILTERVRELYTK